MLRENEVADFINSHNYDLRISGNGRWIDQKCTPDVLTINGDCIIEYIVNNPDSSFTRKDIQLYEYTKENVSITFKKPKTDEALAENEYDKFFSQPLKLLSNVGVLKEEKSRRGNIYTVRNYHMLEYIALREKNALLFLYYYIKKVLVDSSIYTVFDTFLNHPSKNNYENLKNSFENFIIQYTKINGTLECRRIFTKVLNVLAYYSNTFGTQMGRMSRNIITYDMLMYNRNNFRDIYYNKPKGMTRKEFADTNPQVDINKEYYKYQSNKAKKFLRLFNEEYRNGRTEHFESNHFGDKATHIHHIFPEAGYPEICYYLENLIGLTPTQHLNYAHSNGNTNVISEEYQQLLLLSKNGRIQENIENSDEDTIYSFDKFAFVLSVGLDNDAFRSVEDMDFVGIANKINSHYANCKIII